MTEPLSLLRGLILSTLNCLNDDRVSADTAAHCPLFFSSLLFGAFTNCNVDVSHRRPVLWICATYRHVLLGSVRVNAR